MAISAGDPAYPAQLRGLPDAPETLYVRGAWPQPRRPIVAVVGARAASGHGMALARDLASGLAERGALVASGGAVGIDAAAHAGAMAVGAPTLVVLGTGLDAPYPAKNRPLFEEVVRRGGVLLTPFQPRVPLRRWHFPRRNQILAGLADAVVIVEASVASGTLYTAQAARRYGRVLCACPGSPGSEQLLCQGVALAERAEDVLAALAGSPRGRTVAPPAADSDEALALAALDPRAPLAPAEVGARCGVDAVRAARALCALELEGLALLVPGGRYVRSALAAPAVST